MHDLHLHSWCSDGDLMPEAVVEEAYRRGLSGLALTDHNGLWGIEAASRTAHEHGLEFLSGIEVSTYYEGQDIHILGFAEQFREAILEQGLTQTRAGCRERVETMVKKCQEAGFTKVDVSSIEARYKGYKNPSFISFDVARELQVQHGLSTAEAHRMTIYGGTCYVPYAEWLLTPGQAIAMLHSAGGAAILAHPGTTITESSEVLFANLLRELTKHHIDGIEVRHPFHDPPLAKRLAAYTAEHGLLSTAGSDWHGESRFPENNARFGKIGVTPTEWTELLERCALLT